MMTLVGWFRRYGIDARFAGFVLVTMAGSVILGGSAAGLADGIARDEPSSLFVVPLFAMIGAGFAIPVALVAWFIPSAVVFAIVMRGLVARIGERWATRCAGGMTALVAVVATTLVLTGGGRDFDVMGGLMLYIGPAAVLFSPIAVRWCYGPAA